MKRIISETTLPRTISPAVSASHTPNELDSDPNGHFTLIPRLVSEEHLKTRSSPRSSAKGSIQSHRAIDTFIHTDFVF